MNLKLFVAAQTGDTNLYKTALEESGDINQANIIGQTTLMIACEGRHLQLVKFILEEGANINIKDDSGMTARDYVRETGDWNLIGLFNGNIKNIATFETSLYAKLIENVLDILENIKPLLEKMEFMHRFYVLEDFTKTMLLAIKGNGLSEMHKFSFGLVSYYITNLDNSELESLNTLPEKEVVAVFLQTYDGQQNFFKKLESYNYDFTFNSLVLFEDSELDIIKKAYYQYGEIVVKADGKVTIQETENLRQINSKYFKGVDVDAVTGVPAPVTNSAVEAVPTIAKPTENKGTLEDALKELNSLIGLDNIKQDIKSLINIINSNKLRAQEGLPQHKFSLHSVFMGPPGTGKTTIARILANIYSYLGVLPQSNFVETDRAGLVAGYVGQTAIKTDAIVNKAMNGILFIDEAYTLKRGNDENDFGQEAIDILLKRMEDSRENLVIIVAGYEDEMNHFIDSNPGLKSRFNRYFYFNDYSPEQLTEIFSSIAKKSGFVFKETALARVKELFTLLYNNKNKQFGNARLARNIFEKTFENHANRTAALAPITREILTTLEAEDIPFEAFAGVQK